MKILPKILCCLSLLLSSGFLMGQTHLGLKLGSMLPEIMSDDITVSPLASFHGGIFIKKSLGGKLATQAELRYSYERLQNTQGFGAINMNTQMIRMPIELIYGPTSWLELHIGPSIGYKLAQRDEVVSIEGIIPTSYRPVRLAKWEAGMEIGSAFALGSRNKIGIRYYQALTSASRHNSFEGNQYQLGVYLSTKLIKL
ncbi:MAG: outer membrane beta-barrel protein [Bacteroidia bacterium]|nr:outer membrane beta-barrel protein [Bacteroidia bacterium]